MRALLSGPSWLTACCIPSVNKGKRGRSGETQGGERRSEGRGGLRFSYHSNGINGCVGLKLAPDDSGGLAVFLSVIGRFPPPLLSLFLSVFLPSSPYFFPSLTPSLRFIPAPFFPISVLIIPPPPTLLPSLNPILQTARCPN